MSRFGMLKSGLLGQESATGWVECYSLVSTSGNLRGRIVILEH